jgi:hypothetical protein
MIKLSEIIKTDCYIDCGSNQKLREVVSSLKQNYGFKDASYLTKDSNSFISIYAEKLEYIITRISGFSSYPIHHISQIDLNQ